MSCPNVTLKKSEATEGHNLKPGEWLKDAQGQVWVRCQHEIHKDNRPRIGMIHRGEIDPHYWNIDRAGKVTPSIFMDEPNCGWHVYATLDGWTP